MNSIETSSQSKISSVMIFLTIWLICFLWFVCKKKIRKWLKMSSSNVSFRPQPEDIQFTVTEEENIHIEENLLTLIIKLVVNKTRCSSASLLLSEKQTLDGSSVWVLWFTSRANKFDCCRRLSACTRSFWYLSQKCLKTTGVFVGRDLGSCWRLWEYLSCSERCWCWPLVSDSSSSPSSTIFIVIVGMLWLT